MEVGGLRFSTGFDEQLGRDLGRFCDNFGKDFLPVRYFTLSLALATPEEIIGMSHAAWRNSSQFLRHLVRKQDTYWPASLASYFCLIDYERIIVAQFALGETRSVACAKTTPA